MAILAILPTWQALSPATVPTSTLFFLAHTSLFFVMIIRPLADILPQYSFVRPLVILRKGVGVFSSAIIVSFILSKLIVDADTYIGNYFNASYWSLSKLAFFAHSADVAAVILLVTSNNLSKKLLGRNWKRIQKLSYVYFFASGIYVFGSFDDALVLSYMVIVTVLTWLAYLSNKQRALLRTA
jgi:DMSO/TMAO reductase YedYZ heme-binding membrane subunit